MSAAATAAGYLYASGRLRGRSKDEEPAKPERHERRPLGAGRKPIRVAALPPLEEPAIVPPRKPAKPVRVEYRTRRWKPDGV
ncbi:MAG: hypothetical protein ACM30H_02570 [Clostridia bacterium]